MNCVKISTNLILLIIFFGKIYTNAVENGFAGHNRIVGGYRCSVANHKYMVGIMSIKKLWFSCGGSLLSAKWVLSARHCMKHCKTPNYYTVVAGVEMREKELWGKDMQSSIVEGCYKHQFADIGLMNLQKSIRVSPVVAYITPATYAIMGGRKLEKICTNSTLTGWGSQKMTVFYTTVIPYDPHLQCLNLPVISPQECYEKIYGSGVQNISEWDFCAFKQDTDACSGDSGGPLVCNGHQYGIVSYGFGCAYREYPGVYVNVPYFGKFIKNTMKRVNNKISKQRSCLGVKHSFMVAIFRVYLKKPFEYKCAGSLLTKSWVLTSGHCILECATPNNYTVVAGLKDFFRFDPNDKRIISRKVEKCYQTSTYTVWWDIALALMKLKDGFEPSKTVSFVRFATSLDMINKNFEKVCSTARLISYESTKHPRIYSLHCDRMTVISDKVCKEMWSPTYIGKQYGCIDGLKSDDCYANLGAPLICNGIQYGVWSSISCTGNKIKHLKSIVIAKVYEYDVQLFLQNMDKIAFNNQTQNIVKNSNGRVNNLVNLYIFIFCYVLMLM